MCAFIPKCHVFLFFTWLMSGSRARSRFFVEGGALMIVASTIVPLCSISPRAVSSMPTSRNNFGQAVGFQQVPKLQDRRLIGHRIVHQVDAREASHRLRI